MRRAGDATRRPVGRAPRDRAAGARRLPRRRSARDAVQRPSVRAGAARRSPSGAISTMRRRAGRCWRSPRGRRRQGGTRTHRLSRSRRRAARRRVRNAARLRAAEVASTARPAPRIAVSLEPGSGVRKATGTFYTPQPIADYLVRRTLGPLVRDAVARAHPRSSASSIRRWGAARSSWRRADTWPPRTKPRSSPRAAAAPATSATPSASRSGGRSPSAACTASISTRWPCSSRACRCGWPRSPPIGRSAFSITTFRSATACSAPGCDICRSRPHRVGRRRAPTRRAALRRRTTCASALRDALPVRFTLETVAERHARAGAGEGTRVRALSRPRLARSRWKRVADLWCARLVRAVRPPGASGRIRLALGRDSHRAERAAAAHGDATSNTATRHRRGAPVLSLGAGVPGGVLRRGRRAPAGAGFDAVIGNPPWDMMRADAGAPTRVARPARPRRWSASRATRASTPRSPTAMPTDISCSSSARSPSTRHGGRLGLLLPSGLATDHGSAPLRRRLFSPLRRRRDRRHRQSPRRLPDSPQRPLPAGDGVDRRADRRIACRLGWTTRRPRVDRRGTGGRTSSWFPVRLSPALLERLSGPGLAIPDLRDAVDLAIVERAASLFPPLGATRAGRRSLRPRAQRQRRSRGVSSRGARPAGRRGQALEPFRVVARPRSATGITRADARRLLRSAAAIEPRLAYRDVASATNRLTLIAAILPAGCVSTHTVFCLRTPLPLARAAPALRPVQQLRRELPGASARDDARDDGDGGAAADPDCRSPRRQRAGRSPRSRGCWRGRPTAAALARLNARVAALYQLSAAEFEHVLGTFPLIPAEERELALLAFTAEMPGRAV